jgi:hypothetical protein
MEDEAVPNAAAAPNVNDELISALMARLLPDISRLILSSVGQAGQERLPHSVENASSTIAPSVSSSPSQRPAPTDQQEQQAPSRPRQPPPSVVSVTASDPTMDVHGLQRELSAAADTFQLDHLDDDTDEQFPSYEPDYVQSVQAGPPSLVYESAPHPARTESEALPMASPASPFGMLRHPASVPRRATGVTTHPGSVYSLPPFNASPSFRPSANIVLFTGPSGDPQFPQRHGLASPYVPLTQPRAQLRSASHQEIIVDSDRIRERHIPTFGLIICPGNML